MFTKEKTYTQKALNITGFVALLVTDAQDEYELPQLSVVRMH